MACCNIDILAVAICANGQTVVKGVCRTHNLPLDGRELTGDALCPTGMRERAADAAQAKQEAVLARESRHDMSQAPVA